MQNGQVEFSPSEPIGSNGGIIANKFVNISFPPLLGVILIICKAFRPVKTRNIQQFITIYCQNMEIFV